MSKIMDNGEIRDMTPEEQAQFDKDQAAPPPTEEQKPSVEELMAQLQALLKQNSVQ